MPRIVFLGVFFLIGCALGGGATNFPASEIRLLMEPCAAGDCGVAVVLVEDAATGEPIPGANVAAVELGVGAATSDGGAAVVQRLPVGPVAFRVGGTFYRDAIYPSVEVTVTVPAGGLVVERVRLEGTTEGIVY